MYINPQKANRLRKKERMTTVFKNGISLDSSVHSRLSRAEYEKNKQDFFNNEKIHDVRIGNNDVVVIYKIPKQKEN